MGRPPHAGARHGLGRSVHRERSPGRRNVLVDRRPVTRTRARAARAATDRAAAPATAGAAPSTSLWYKDAVIYELHVRAYQDSNADGVGDFAGLVNRLDHVRDLGATAIWLLPFYPSPLRDDGYDIAAYKAI